MESKRGDPPAITQMTYDFIPIGNQVIQKFDCLHQVVIEISNALKQTGNEHFTLWDQESESSRAQK